ncbi:hypothetical protein [Lichenicoccus sp.]|uniref:hypothetical protein n=1 Tax=Lichenicoccus sp. TaxID=2781899 RepID=UPI003D0F594D
MIGADDGRLYALMEIAEAQQAAVQAAIAGLAAKRVALAEARHAGGRDGEPDRGGDGGCCGGGGGDAAVARRRGGGDGACRAGLEAALRQVVLWASWRLLGWIAATVAAVLLWWLASTAVLWWDTEAVASMQVRKARLEAQACELKATHDERVKARMLRKLDHCGPSARLCIRLDESAGAFGDQSDYRVIKGY